MRDVQIETARLLLRRYAMSDVEDLVALHADPEVGRFIPLPEFSTRSAPRSGFMPTGVNGRSETDR
jgi:RimJ/RimL family protein N-acetyltransferase